MASPLCQCYFRHCLLSEISLTISTRISVAGATSLLLDRHYIKGFTSRPGFPLSLQANSGMVPHPSSSFARTAQLQLNKYYYYYYFYYYPLYWPLIFLAPVHSGILIALLSNPINKCELWGLNDVSGSSPSPDQLYLFLKYTCLLWRLSYWHYVKEILPSVPTIVTDMINN